MRPNKKCKFVRIWKNWEKWTNDICFMKHETTASDVCGWQIYNAKLNYLQMQEAIDLKQGTTTSIKCQIEF